MNKLTFEFISIELTRRCNMKCRQCLRGEAQDVDIDHRYIDALLDQTQLIGRLFLTGGEPALMLDTIEYIANELCKRGIPLLNLELYTNGLIYSTRFIEIIKRFKKIINVSCINCFADDSNYQPKEETSRCVVGVSLDRYHENHEQCLKHYEKYKKALHGTSDVIKIMRGNAPKKYGRAKCLTEHTIDQQSAVYKYYPLQRIEILDKDHVPVCQVYDSYRMFDPEQKIVCCTVCLDSYGMLSVDYGGALEYRLNDSFPKICNVADADIWESILEYNKGRIPCAEWQAQTTKILQQSNKVPLADIMKSFNPPKDAQDEPTTQEIREEYQKLTKAGSSGVMGVIISDMIKQAKTLNNWKQVAEKAACYSYYDGDKRGNVESQADTDQIKRPTANTEQKKRPVVRSFDGFRCFNCGKVIQNTEGRNIHCTQMENSLKCEYCGAINTVEFFKAE